MTTQTYSVAIIGAGTVVQRGHIPNFQSIPHVSVEAICDVNEERLEIVAAEEGIPQTFTDYNVMLNQVKPDITVNATMRRAPSGTAELAFPAMEAGLLEWIWRVGDRCWTSAFTPWTELFI